MPDREWHEREGQGVWEVGVGGGAGANCLFLLSSSPRLPGRVGRECKELLPLLLVPLPLVFAQRSVSQNSATL